MHAKPITKSFLVCLCGLILAKPPIVRADAASPITCRFETAPTTDDLTLTAVARSNGALQARYRLSVTKNDRSGQSISIQSGAVSTKPGQTQSLATVTFPSEASGHVEADLQITWDRGHTSCSFP